MKLDLFDVDEFIEINDLKEVTSPILFERGGTPNPNGLLSNEIFGYSTKSRKETFAYINLHGEFFHPHIYKVLKRIFRNIEKIVNGEKYYVIKNGELVPDDSGETGIKFLYDNWNKLKWVGNEGMSKERYDLIANTPKKEIFINKMIVIPVFYRDITTASSGGGDVPEIDNLYAKLIRNASLLDTDDMFDFSFHKTNFNIQNILVEIYDDFKTKLEKKKGIIRKYLLGKNVDQCVRTVITGPVYNTDRPEDNITNFERTAVPLSQAITMCQPFVIGWLKNFFMNNLIEGSYLGQEEGSYVKNPEGYYNEKYLEKHVDKYVFDPSSRYDTIEVPLEDGNFSHLKFQGIMVNVPAERAIVDRYMTWTDLLYIALVDITKDKHLIVTRYPVNDPFGVFFTKINVASTRETVPMNVNGTIYKWYPKIDLNMDKASVSYNFVDSMRFSNSFLQGINGDYDGDQVTAKVAWTNEANVEIEKLIKSKKFYMTTNGSPIRVLDKEFSQTLFTLTKNPV